MTSDQSIRIAVAAIQWVKARKEVAALKKQRGALQCENESTIANNPVRPCWKSWEPFGVNGDSAERLDRSEWCAPCLKREEIHEQLKPLIQRHGVLMRSLQALAGNRREMSAEKAEREHDWLEEDLRIKIELLRDGESIVIGPKYLTAVRNAIINVRDASKTQP